MTSYANTTQAVTQTEWKPRGDAWYDNRGKHWPARAEAWLDRKGKGAWIAATVLGFIFFWPVGLALLIYMIWSKEMFAKNRTSSRALRTNFRSSGNTAFDAYKADTLRRLQEEQESFENFLERLREAKDKNEFDQFMDERARTAKEAASADADAETSAS